MSMRRSFFFLVLSSILLLSSRGYTMDPEGTTPRTVQSLTGSTAYDHYRFGDAVAIDAGHLVIASPGHLGGPHGGIVYVYKKDVGYDQWGNTSGPGVWGLMKKITVTEAVPQDEFGGTVAIAGDILAVAAPSDPDKGDHAGGVYIFHRNKGGEDNWGLVKKIYASDAVAQGYFGQSIALRETILLVGATGPAEMLPGRAYLFSQDEGGTDNWGEVKKLSAANGTAWDRFGSSVALDGDIAAVGAEFAEEDQATDAGKVYLYYRNEGGAYNWGEKRVLSSPAIAADRRFGCSVSLHNGILAVSTGNGQRLAYLFYRNEGGEDAWGLKKEFLLPESGLDVTGYKVAIQGDILAIGGTLSGDRVERDGRIHRYHRNEGGPDNWGELPISEDETAPVNSDAFGRAFALSGTLLLAGEPRSDRDGEESGNATIYNDYASAEKRWGIAREFGPTEIPWSELTNNDDSLLSDGDVLPVVDEAPEQVDANTSDETTVPDDETGSEKGCGCALVF